MFHLVLFLMLNGQPIDAATKVELSMDACVADKEVLPSQLLAAVKASGAPADVTIKAACMDDVEYNALVNAMRPQGPETRGAALSTETGA
jgi:hypothetical protein